MRNRRILVCVNYGPEFIAPYLKKKFNQNLGSIIQNLVAQRRNVIGKHVIIIYKMQSCGILEIKILIYHTVS